MEGNSAFRLTVSRERLLRLKSVVFFAVVSALFWGGLVTPSAAGAASLAPTVCAEQASVSSCDSDNDGIPDAVERKVCGSATCATGREDVDHDGIPDWVEVEACGTVRCASPTTDTDGDGIPDYAEILTCGTATCSTGREDADADGIPDWVEFVICGSRSCANGSEDYDHDGISDAKELAACLIRFDVTSAPIKSGVATWPPTIPRIVVRLLVVWWPLWVGGLLALAGISFAVVTLIRRRRNKGDGDWGEHLDDLDPVDQVRALLKDDK